MTSYFGLLVLESGGYRGKIFSDPKTAKFVMLTCLAMNNAIMSTPTVAVNTFLECPDM